MNRTIAQRIYWSALVPLALLAVLLVAVNGYSRIQDAHHQLDEAQKVTGDLLIGAAVDALVVGNTLNFEQLIEDLYARSDVIGCVSLRDSNDVLIAEVGTCPNPWPIDQTIAVKTSLDELSDFPGEYPRATIVGKLLVSTREDQLNKKVREIIMQLLITIALVLGVFFLISRLVQKRVIRPIRKIDATMKAVSEQRYDERIDISGDDELGRLSSSINATMNTVQEYMRELTERRDDADRALGEADQAFMQRDALIRAMTEDLKGPMDIVHSELTTIAIANNDPQLSRRIKTVIALLQESDSNFTDLIEIATHETRPQQSPRFRDLGDIVTDMKRDISVLSETEQIPIHFVISQNPLDSAGSSKSTGLFICLDSVRWKKSLVHIIRAVGRHCTAPGIYITVELIKIDDARLNVSFHLKAFYDRRQRDSQTAWIDSPTTNSHVPPPMLEWTDREKIIIAYLLRALGVTPTYSVSHLGTINIMLDTVCQFSVHATASGAFIDQLLEGATVAATIVTNDTSLARLATRGELSNHDLALMSFSRAGANAKLLNAQDALLIDISDDIALAVNLVEQLQSENGNSRCPELIAVCPPGQLSEKLSNRLFELGFRAVVQKPLQLAHVVEALRTTRINPLDRIGASDRES